VRDQSKPSTVTKIVTKTGTNPTKAGQSQKTEIVAILRPAKGFG
jgi:hypothetical protein